MRKLTYLVATSIDGFIGDPEGEAGFFADHLSDDYVKYYATEYPEALPTRVRRALGIDDRENRRFDTVFQGRGSYEVGLREGVTSPYAHLRQYVASRSLTESPDPAVELVSGDLVARMRELKGEDGLGIYLCGGAQVVGELIDEIDELVIKTYPYFLGSGMPLAATGFAVREFTLDSAVPLDNGAVFTTYSRKSTA